MPVYTYLCESCGVRFERLQGFNDPVLTRCPECNKKALRKVYTPVGIVFKGSGFYSTDHRSSSGSFNRSAKPTETEKSPEPVKTTSEKTSDS
ncbi:MAG: FmdB family transcriptional regulator [Chloroflexi bacterium RBG_19FT_COMBO_49_13]|nr:MAG: FmdB family transcriptional regulator [Chloroflexi bacterium RBG_19FT_COMBO_49_13]